MGVVGVGVGDREYGSSFDKSLLSVDVRYVVYALELLLREKVQK